MQARYILDLAKHFQSGELSDEKIATMDDDTLVEELTKVKGIGEFLAQPHREVTVLAMDQRRFQQDTKRMLKCHTCHDHIKGNFSGCAHWLHACMKPEELQQQPLMRVFADVVLLLLMSNATILTKLRCVCRAVDSGHVCYVSSWKT